MKNERLKNETCLICLGDIIAEAPEIKSQSIDCDSIPRNAIVRL